jgi:hypothetical protein
MVKGLEEELKERLNGGRKYLANAMSPSPQYETAGGIDDGNWGLSTTSAASTTVNAKARNELPILRQGPSIGGIKNLAKYVGGLVLKRIKREPKS